MPSQLAATAKGARIFFYGTIAAIIVYIAGSQLFGLGLAYLNSIRPKPQIPASVGFGKLPSINFKSTKLANYPPFELDNTTGELPTFPKKLEVYEILEPKSSYLSLDKSKDLAKRLGFSSAPQNLSSSIYYWENENQTLKMNIYTQNFVLDTDLSKVVIPIGNFSQASAIQQKTKEILAEKGLLNFGYKDGGANVTLAAFENGKVVRAESYSDASLARVDFYRTLKDPEAKEEKEYPPLLPPNPNEGNVQMIVYSPRNDVVALKISYNNWEINKAAAETYPLKTVGAAWQELTSGTAAISSVVNKSAKSLEPGTETNLEKVFVRNIYLAYFDDENLQKYLQPIYVFEGDSKDSEGSNYSVTAYVPAIDPAWTEQ